MSLSFQTATAEIKRRLATGKVIFTDHALLRMAERGFDRDEILSCLKRGVVIGCDFDTSHQDWTYRIELRHSRSRFMTTVVAIPDDDCSDIIVTVF